MKYSKNKKVSFDSGTHSYFLKNKKLTSVTTLINKFKNEFDSDFWSKKIAKKENTTQQIILKKWKDKAFKSTEIGTAIHKIFEDYTNQNYCVTNGKLEFEYNKLNSEFMEDFNLKKEISLKFINDFFITKRLIPVESEFIVYNDFLAGQLDMICKDKDGNFYILDFKTNEKIDTFSYGKTMKGIFSHLDDASYFHYCLQLSIYKRMLKQYDIKKIFLVHITTENYFFIECENILDKVKLEELI